MGFEKGELKNIGEGEEKGKGKVASGEGEEEIKLLKSGEIKERGKQGGKEERRGFF